MGDGQRPWYLQAESVYEAFKETLNKVLDVISKEANEPSSTAVLKATEFINSSSKLIDELTSYKKLFSQKQSTELIQQLDEFITNSLLLIDNKTDIYRSKFAESLITLKFSIAKHSNWVKTTTKDQKEKVFTYSEQKYNNVKSVIENFTKSIGEIIVWYRKQSPQIDELLNKATNFYENVSVQLNLKIQEHTLNNWQLYLQTKGFNIASKWLNIVQPYIHKVVTITSPVVLMTGNVVKPTIIKYGNTISPYVTSVADKVKVNVTDKFVSEETVNYYTDTAKKVSYIIKICLKICIIYFL